MEVTGKNDIKGHSSGALVVCYLFLRGLGSLAFSTSFPFWGLGDVGCEVLSEENFVKDGCSNTCT